MSGSDRPPKSSPSSVSRPTSSRSRLPRLSDDDDTEATLSTAMQRLKALQRPKATLLPRLTSPDVSEDDASRTHRTSVVAQPAAVRGAGHPRVTVLTGVSAGTIVPLDNRSRLVLGRARGTDLRLIDRGVSRQHARIRRADDGFVVEDLSSTNGTLLNGVRLTKAKLSPGDRLQIGPNVVIQFSIFDDTEEKVAVGIANQSTRDPLTDTFGRQYFLERLSAEAAYARRHGTPLSLVVLELDKVNLAHLGGAEHVDALLRSVAAIISRLAREEDTLCRLSGREFGVVLRGEALKNSGKMAERLRRAVEAAHLASDAPSVFVTVSIGVAELHECRGKEGDELLRIALERTHRVASRGGNGVCLL